MDMSNPTTPAAAPTILDEIRTFLSRFVAFTNEDHEMVLALWVLHTWTFEAAYSTPYIYINSAEKQSGKTRTIETLGYLARNPVVAAQVSAASLFRSIESQRPSIFLDEVDAIWSGAANEDLRGLLNSGYNHKGRVMRVVPVAPDSEDDGVRYFSTFSPKLLAGIDNGQLPDTIADRSINIVLKRKKGDVEVERLQARKIEPEAAALCKKIEEWAEANMDAIMATEPAVIEEISDRAFDIAEPLLQVAMQFRGMMRPARAALTRLLTRESAPLSLQAQCLAKAKEIMEETKADKLASATLAAAMEVSPKRLGILLAPYGITPRTIRLGSNTVKGYNKRDFQDSWERYL